MGAAKYSATRDKGLVDLRSPRNLNVLNFLRASNGARYNSAGIMEQCWPNVARYDYDPMTVTRANYFKNSEDLSAPAWTLAGATLVGGGVNKLIESSGGTFHCISQPSRGVGSTVEMSVTAAPAGRDWIWIQLGTSVGYFNVAAGTVGTVGFGFSGSIQPDPLGGYRCTLSGSPATSNRIIGVATGDGVPSYSGDGVSGAYLHRLCIGPVGSGYIKTGVLRRGVERLTNGDFSAGSSGWSVVGTDGTHLATFSGGTLRYQSDTLTPILTVSQAGALMAGRSYEITTVCSAWTSGAVKIDTAENPAFVIADSVGTTVKQFTATSTQLNIYRNSLNVDLTIDSISIREVNTDFASPQGNGQLRGLLVEQAATNRLLRSDDFSVSPWGRSNVTVTTNAIVAPDGTLSADKIEATTTGFATIIQEATLPGTSASWSIFIKKGSGATDGNTFVLRNIVTATNLIIISFNYDTGVASGAPSNTVVESLPDGWWRLTLFTTSGITSGDGLRLYVGFAGNTETAGEHFYAWGAQLEVGDIPSAYIPTTSATVTRAIDAPKRQGGVAAIGYVDGPGTIYAEFAYAGRGSVATSGSRSAVSIDDGSAADRVGLYNASGGTAGLCQAASVTQAVPFIASSVSQNTFIKVAMAFAAGDFQIARGGTLSAVEVVGSLPNPSLVDVWLGRSFGNVLNGWIKKFHYTPRRLDATTLGKMTT